MPLGRTRRRDRGPFGEETEYLASILKTRLALSCLKLRVLHCCPDLSINHQHLSGSSCGARTKEKDKNETDARKGFPYCMFGFGGESHWRVCFLG